MQKIVVLFFLYFIAFEPSVFSSTYESPFFRNISVGSRASSVNCFAQDSLGMLWVGSNSGLYSYDGYSLHQHTAADIKYQTFIYSIAVLDKTYLALGTEHGVWLYNYNKDRYEDFPKGGPSDVRALLFDGEYLWIGSLTGLYRYHVGKRTIENYGEQLKNKLGNQTVYTLLKENDRLLVGTYNGLYTLNSSSGEVRHLSLPDYNIHRNQFVNSLLASADGHGAYVGTEYGLYYYNYSTRQLQKRPVLKKHPIKSMIAYDNKTLLLGTDDGLFVYRTDRSSLERIKHDSRNPNSLANNIIWGMYADRNRNIWIGTDLGLSLWAHQQFERKLPIYRFTSRSDGNRFYKITQDRHGWYWLGGDNGLIRTNTLADTMGESFWYRMDAQDLTLPHNRIRDIYEDPEGLLWIASDGGVNLFDPKTKAFRNFEITDRTGKRNAKWAYDVFDDHRGRLWIATYLGGIFSVDKSKLIASDGKYISLDNYNVTQGLLADFANQILQDNHSQVWALFYNKGLNKIDPTNGRVQLVKDEQGNPVEQATFMLMDKEGCIWIGQHGKVLRIGSDGSSRTIVFDPVGLGEVTAMEEVEQMIWLATGDGLWQLDKKLLTFQTLKHGQAISAMYYNALRKEVYLGGIDEVLIMPAKQVSGTDSSNRQIVLTAIYVNNERFGAYDYGVRYRDEIVLNHGQNNLRLEFSNLDYGNDVGYRLVYAFKGRNERWIVLERGDNKVQLANLSSGAYKLQVAKMDMQEKIVSDIFEVDVDVKYPWYANGWARFLYALLLIGLILWIINFFRVRNKLKLERMERKKVLELSKHKMDFLTTISHELKTPLSLILAPVSQLIFRTRDTDKKKQLENIQQNALKINTLIQEVMEFDKKDGESVRINHLIHSRIELVSFTRRLFDTISATAAYRHLSFTFSSSTDAIFIESDVTKLESVLTNILTNACKHNPKESGRISLDISQTEEQVAIVIDDNGIGISKEDLPYVFSKFYRASSSLNKRIEGTGVGLYLVKSYCEQMGWKIQIDSELAVGTQVKISLAASAILMQEDLISDPFDGDRRKLLIVEDNEELSLFLSQTLEGDYLCKVARDGREALELCEKSYIPDLIVSDAMMPILGGLEMARQLRKNTLTSTIPIILLTAKSDKQTEHDSLAAGIDAFISKPFDLDFLKMQINQLITRKERLSEQLRLDEISKPRVEAIESTDERLLVKVTQVIEAHIDDSDFTVQKLSENAGIGVKQLYRKIKQLTALTPVEYIRSIRMKKAAILLRQKKFTIAEVMYMVGYSNASYFSKCFQSEFGVTPKVFVERDA